MTNCGHTLKHWQMMIPRPEKRMEFIMKMLRQMIRGLQKLHSFGYSHGDLKCENICARVGHSSGKFKFTLIDLGVVSKLPRIGEDSSLKSFRGNFMVASPDHIIERRASVIDDIYSLLCVAYMFVTRSLPWLDFMK